ncbi:PAS domain S-box protein [Bacillus spizizenii]|nr:PAS domain S-box protein [Bacillus spizizenii]MCY8890560.1 PAS domain S-box protein [Bacillus spizizenii]MEC0842019.1 PAS domain S-box protein [Bacillus spizizenii]
MILRRKIYYALIVALSVGGVVFHKTAAYIVETFPDVYGVNSYIVMLGLVYLALTISVIEYFILYRLKHLEGRLGEAKEGNYVSKKKVLDTSKDDEIGNIAGAINDVLGNYEQKSKQAKKSDEMYTSIVDDVPLLVYRFLPDGTITFVNESYAKTHQKTREELVGQNIFELIDAAGGNSQSIKRNLNMLRPDKQSDSYFYDTPIVAEGGSPRWVMWINRGFFDEYGRASEFQSVGMDLYQQATDGLNNMMNDILSLVYFVNKDGRLKYASPTNEGILGFKPSDMVGKSIFDFIHDENREYLEGQLDRRFSNKEKQTDIQELRIKNDRNQYTLVRAAIDSIVASNGSVSNVAINARDITDLKQAGGNLADAYKGIKKMMERVNTLEFIIEKSPVITFVWKEGDSSIDYVSGNISLLGYEKEDFINGNITFDDIVHPEDRDDMFKRMDNELAIDTEFDPVEYRLLSKYDQSCLVRDTTFAVVSNDSEVTFYKGIELISKSSSVAAQASETLPLREQHIIRK